MLNFLPGKVKMVSSFLMLVVGTLFIFMFFFPVAILKLIPIGPTRKFFSWVLIQISETWISYNNFNFALHNKIRWDVEGLEGLAKKEWYLVVSNHQSWTDILVLQRVFNRKVPFLKFFIKKELIYVPVMGFAWWALDYPFMKRYSKEFLDKHPEKKGQDLATTKKACEKFKTLPVAVMNFVEGTRFSEEKKNKTQSPYDRLLQPKAAGIAYVLAAMGDQINRILNVTIAYPCGVKGLWGFLAGEVPHVKVHIEDMAVTGEIMGDYFEDENYRREFQIWINDLWKAKDERLALMLGEKDEEPGIDGEDGTGEADDKLSGRDAPVPN